MKKIAKTLTALLLAGTTLSLMCGCDNGAANDKNSSVSGGSSDTQSTANDKSDASNKDESKPDNTSSKDESKTDDTSSKDNSKPDEASDPDYEKMMEAVDKIKTAPDRTIFSNKENVIKLLGKPDSDFTGGNYPFTQYNYGKYTLQISHDLGTSPLKIIVATWNNETEKVISAFEIDASNGEISSRPTEE